MEKNIKVLFASSECSPFVKVGGLADVVGSLPVELNKQGVDARVIIPLYKKIKVKYIDPAQVLPTVVSDPGTPGDSFGATGTFTVAVDLKWIEEEYEVKDNTRVLWDHMYACLREGGEYPIKRDEVVSLITALCRIKNETPICCFGDR